VEIKNGNYINGIIFSRVQNKVENYRYKYRLTH